MYKDKNPRQETMWIPGSLSDYVPEDHILRKVDAVLDLSFLKAEVKSLYSDRTGRPCIEPESALRLMLAGFFHGIVHDRKLMREAQVNLAYRWFAGYELTEVLPDHSSLTRIRQRWGEDRFRRIFEQIVGQCIKAGLVGGDTCHIDASLIRADVSWQSLVKIHVDAVISENEDNGDEGQDRQGPSGRTPTKTGKRRTTKIKKVSKTDPEASMATSSKKQRLEPTYKQHTVVDDKAGIVIDVHVTTGESNEGLELASQIERIKNITGKNPKRITADRGYSSSNNYALLENSQIEALIPPSKETVRKGRIPLRRFKYDELAGIVRCPKGKVLAKGSKGKGGTWYRAKACDCAACPLRAKCVPESSKSRSVMILDGYTALLRARREKEKGWCEDKVRIYGRHRYQVEGIHGESKTEHGMRRAVRRGRSNVGIQSYLTAIVIDLKRLALHGADGSLPTRNCWNAARRMLTNWLINRYRSIPKIGHPFARLGWST